jgi:hypothetical protein
VTASATSSLADGMSASRISGARSAASLLTTDADFVSGGAPRELVSGIVKRTQKTSDLLSAGLAVAGLGRE